MVLPHTREATAAATAATAATAPAAPAPQPLDINAMLQMHMLSMMQDSNRHSSKARDIEITEASRFRMDLKTIIVIICVVGAWFDNRNTLANLKTSLQTTNETQATMQREARMLSKELEELRLSMVQNGIKLKIHDLD
jgi:hypothetical protein